MKKIATVSISLLLALGIILEIFIPLVTPKKFFKSEDIQSANVFIGESGKSFEIADVENIARLIKLIQDESLYRSTILPIHEDGFSYGVSFFNEKGRGSQYLRISPGFIDVNGYQYKRKGDGNYTLPAYEYLKELETKYVNR